MLSIKERMELLEKGQYVTKYGFIHIAEENYQGYGKMYLHNDEIILVEIFSLNGVKIEYRYREWEYAIFDYCFWYEEDQAEWKKHFGE